MHIEKRSALAEPFEAADFQTGQRVEVIGYDVDAYPPQWVVKLTDADGNIIVTTTQAVRELKPTGGRPWR